MDNASVDVDCHVVELLAMTDRKLTQVVEGVEDQFLKLWVLLG
jgi:hypothetical protein